MWDLVLGFFSGVFSCNIILLYKHDDRALFSFFLMGNYLFHSKLRNSTG